MIEYGTQSKPTRSVLNAMGSGIRGKCPNCNEGRLFAKYLKVADKCNVCGEELHHHRADDAPAYFVIFIVGHIVIPLVLFIEVNYGWPLWVHSLVWLPVALALSLIFLPLTKGALVGVQWANFMHGFDGGEKLGSTETYDTELHALHESHETAPPAQ